MSEGRKIYLTVYEDDRRCGGCNWDTSRFYRVGKDHIGKEDGVHGDGLCADCLMELMIEAGCRVISPRDF